MAKQIPLTQGKFATVDDDVYEWAKEFKWFAQRNGSRWYAIRHEGKGQNRTTVYLHREIMKAPPGVQVDHEDRDGLNCLRSNMRLATHAQNQQNSGPQVRSTSGYKGVTWNKKDGKWQARIGAGGKYIFLGQFTDKAEAARAYDSAAREHHGNFAYQNFPEETS